ncbi:unnamed protein product [Brugia timori]|uniref:Uncharacterized protein n=1 Tax=Brugia timori TaxID=42155 RepID=A0A0R3R429_9BILA|nr:unnamed protein product [Brugia timori]
MIGLPRIGAVHLDVLLSYNAIILDSAYMAMWFQEPINQPQLNIGLSLSLSLSLFPTTIDS